mgnify:CR=1 FL=1
MHKIIEKTKRFIRNEDGIATAWSIGWLILCFSIAGLSIDVTNAWKVKQFLQSTADVSAHAGGLVLGSVNNEGIQAAVAIEANKLATINMNQSRYGDVLVNSDIIVGFWDGDTKIFTELEVGDTDIPNAVRAITRQDGIASSSVGTFFLRFVGFDAFTVAASATVEKFVSMCETDGIISAGVVEMSTTQKFWGNFCVHGQGGLKMSQSNEWNDETIASMSTSGTCDPDVDRCTDDDTNPGIVRAFRYYNRPNTKATPESIAGYIGALQIGSRDVISTDVIPDGVVVNTTFVDQKDFDVTTLVANTIYTVSCSNDAIPGVRDALRGNDRNKTSVEMGNAAAHTTVSNVVIISDCVLNFDDTVTYQDAIIATTSTNANSINGSSGVSFGNAAKSCAPGGDVILISQGGAGFAAKWESYDLEMVVAGDVSLASRSSSGDPIVHTGTNIYNGGDVKLTTKHEFVSCPNPQDPSLDLKYTLRYVE